MKIYLQVETTDDTAVRFKGPNFDLLVQQQFTKLSEGS